MQASFGLSFRRALPKPGVCIALSFGGTTAQGYTGSPIRVLALRPGTYWLSVSRQSTSDSTATERSLMGP